ncbi:hypothetical protein [Oryzobacter telluris]|uniref:hypothetical protein n=1 Tax=Oryzobacter telluris TaxID=3149179 RepID=UPI00370D5C4B
MLDEIPRFGTAIGDVPALIAAGATTFAVTPGGTTATPESQLKVRGTLTWSVTDPDGAYGNVTLSVRHSSGYVVRSQTLFSATGSLALRPGSFTVCATESGVTRCNGDATSHDTAPPLVVESDGTVAATITLP